MEANVDQRKTTVWSVKFGTVNSVGVRVAADSAADAIYYANRVRPDEARPITSVTIEAADVYVVYERG